MRIILPFIILLIALFAIAYLATGILKMADFRRNDAINIHPPEGLFYEEQYSFGSYIPERIAAYANKYYASNKEPDEVRRFYINKLLNDEGWEDSGKPKEYNRCTTAFKTLIELQDQEDKICNSIFYKNGKLLELTIGSTAFFQLDKGPGKKDLPGGFPTFVKLQISWR